MCLVLFKYEVFLIYSLVYIVFTCKLQLNWEGKILSLGTNFVL